MRTHRQTRHPLSIPPHSQLQPFSPSTMDSSVSLCLDHTVMGHNLSRLLKLFLLKKLLRPLRRLEQPMMSIETQDSTRQASTHYQWYTYSNFQSSTKHAQIQQLTLLPFSAVSNQRIEFTKGLFALIMAQDHQTAFLQVTNEIHIQSSISIMQPIFTLDVGHPLSGETQRKSSYLWPYTWPQPCEAQAKDPQSAFMSLPIHTYMHITNGNHQGNKCPHCQCYLGHWFYHNFPKKFRSQPIQSNNGLMVHHIQYCKNRTSIWFFRLGQRQYHSFAGHSRILLHEQLKLAGAARGLPGDHGPPKSSFFAYQYNLPLHRKTSGHKPCRASQNRSHQCLRSQSSIQRRHQSYNSQRRTNRQQYRLWLSQRLRWMGSTLPIPSGSA